METQLEKELMRAGDAQKGILYGGTHPDGFHADDILCAVILRTELPQYHWQWIRTRHEDLLKKCNIVFDVGGGTYDHHGAPVYYPNGVMMAACGKLLNDMYDDWALKEELRKGLFYTVEQQDNGAPITNGYRLTSNKLACVASFVPMWNEDQSPQAMDAAFAETVDFVMPIFARELIRANSMLQARDIARNCNRIFDGKVMVMEDYVPWTDVAIADPDVRCCIYRDASKKWRIQMVPKEYGSKELRYALPERWRGTRLDQCKLATGIDDAIFVHPTGFLAGFGSRESCIKVAKIVCSM